ncbi:SEC-C domain-containing protein [Bradyrhizobium diazoefficiens]|nr:SEC-C domain-containing protein [Bradyrhizobium diazoefficiens]
MVKEPRFMRRGLAEKMLTAVQRFPDAGPFSRQVTFLPSYQPNVAYVLLQLRAPDAYRAEPDYREKRRAVLEVACGAAKNKFQDLVKVIGIGIDAPKFSGGTNAEDFILMPCETWTQDLRSHYEEQNQDWNFFVTSNLRQHNDLVTQFVQPPHPSKPATPGKIGRNDRCPCGSGLKYKRCCLPR